MCVILINKIYKTNIPLCRELAAQPWMLRSVFRELYQGAHPWRLVNYDFPANIRNVS